MVIRLLKGIYNLRPALPKTGVTWDPEIVLNFLKTLSPVKSLNLKKLTFKTVTLLWLLTGQRGQSMQLIHIKNLTVTDHLVKIRFGDLLKSTRPGFQQEEIKVKAYAPDRRLCVVTVLKEYLNRTKMLRDENISQLFITSVKPFKGASKDTIARWVKTVMDLAGLDTQIFTPHSVRSASTSAALKANVPLQTILSTAGWTRNSTFAKYYNKPVKSSDFSTKIIEATQKPKK